MNQLDIDGVSLTPLKKINAKGGDVYHALKKSDYTYSGFGEAYFSSIDYKFIKAWKKHNKMTLNLIVPVGEIRFVIYDNRSQNKSEHRFASIDLSLRNYYRLSVNPGLWIGFMGLDKNKSILLNIADIEHDYNEAERVPIDEFNHPEGTTVVGIGSTYFTGPSGSCTVHAGWKYTTESGFFNPNLPTNSDLFKTLRETRDVLLNQSDWTRMDDNQLSSDKKAEWATYRQALRDLPANTADPANPTYPTKPS